MKTAPTILIAVILSLTLNLTLFAASDSSPGPIKPAPSAANAITGHVTDATTGAPIKKFRVILRPADTRNWQQHTAKACENGAFSLPIRRWPKTIARIDADGYKPVLSRVFEEREGAVTLDFKLEPDPGISGTVLDDHDKPAKGARVALGTKTQEVMINNGRMLLSDILHKTIRATDDDGKFIVPSEIEPAVLAVAADEGYAAVQVHEAGELKSPIKLARWGRIEGTLLRGPRPAAGWIVNSQRSESGPDHWPLIHQFTDGQADASGKFLLDRVPPGKLTVMIIGRTKDGSEPFVHGTATQVDLAPGETLKLTLGGAGRPVIGRFVSQTPIDFTKLKVWIAPEAPHIGFPGDEAFWEIQGRWMSEGVGALYQQDIKPDGEGRFKINRLAQGTYRIYGVGLKNERDIVISPMENGTSEQPLDLGDLQLAN